MQFDFAHGALSAEIEVANHSPGRLLIALPHIATPDEPAFYALKYRQDAATGWQVVFADGESLLQAPIELHGPASLTLRLIRPRTIAVDAIVRFETNDPARAAVTLPVSFEATP